MQSGYGGVSEIPQFMVESCGSSLFSISPVNPSAAVAPSDVKYHHPLHQPHPHYPHNHHQQQHHHQSPHPQPHHHHQQPHPTLAPSPLPPHFSHFHHGIPITQQLFQQPHHQLQLFHHHQLSHPLPPQLEPRRLIPPHQLGLDQESAPENSASPTRIMGGPGGTVASDGGGGGGPSFLAATMNFKLAVNESSGGGSRDGINDDDGGILQGEEDGSESRLHHWQREDESAIKEPSWRPLDIDYINTNSKRCKNKEPETSTSCKYSKKSKEVAESDDGHATGVSNYKLFSELEAIYKPGGSTGGGGGPNQTGSGSALTADEAPIVHGTAMAAMPGLPAGADNRVGGGSETSAGEEATAKKFSKSSSRRRRKRRHQQHQQQLNSVAAFLENLVKQLMDHQESLHRRFLEVMEKRDQERTSREEAWRKQEAAKSSREAAARAHERALSSSREAAIVAFLEKITGETLNLPPRPQLSDVEAYKELDSTDAANNNDLQIEPISSVDGLNAGDGGDACNKVMLNTSRWPKAEVQALIRVRSGLETRFQEPGLKGPLWEEVSMTMAAMGYSRNAKRCKEKWENINKYFRKTKESGKKRPQHSKTCPYFQQLDQLYSKSVSNKQQQQQPAPLPASSSSPNTANMTSATANKDQRNDGCSELLDAIVVSTDNRINLKFSDMSTVGYDFNGGKGGRNDASEDNDMEMAGNEEEEDELERGGEGSGDGGEEGEGESQEYHLHQDKEEEEEDEEDEEDLHDSALFFQRLQS